MLTTSVITFWNVGSTKAGTIITIAPIAMSRRMIGSVLRTGRRRRGGTFSAKFEPIAVGMVEQKVKCAQEVHADYIISTDMSCLLHMDSYIKKQKLNMKVMHLADVLASGWE